MANEEIAIYQTLTAPPPGVLFTWSGGFAGLVTGTQDAWFACDRLAAGLFSTTAIGWPSPGPRRLRGLRVKIYANGSLTSVEVEITANGAPTGVKVTPGTSTGAFEDIVNSFDCANGAEVGLRARSVNGGVALVSLCASAIGAPIAPP